ncbi:colanic acid biosynthesis glycosyltransferase WcaL [Yersinia intermedia]|uniref:glycosyltransferase family 4 protein n=1 Tax=Yersinia intermedia TaxID=631 RepID=UPI0005E5B525|nr:glycosyltransferase family 4 protein [Yersinia intermedia]CNI49904.1 colanic acid biosynthesis glycosyltransferase WcaL [Yersinia intermedia]
MRIRSVLFIGALPPPITGQSVACKALYDDFKYNNHNMEFINLSKDSLVSGISSFGRILEIVKIVIKIILSLRGKDLIYFTPAESIAGNLKDIIIYFLIYLYGKISLTYIHMHGGAGMKEILSDKHPTLKIINSFFIRRLAGVIVLGDRLVSIYEPFIDKSKISVVKNFATTESFIKYSELKYKNKNRDIMKILYLSNLIKSKGYNDLLDAYFLLGENCRCKLEINFAGGFESAFQEKEFLNRINNIDNIKYHGIVKGKEKKELFTQSDVFCLPTYYPYEGQPISILEAYAAGCTVITTDHSGIYDVFTPEVNGLSVRKNDPSDIKKALERLLEDKLLLRKFSIINARTACTKYRLAHHLTQLRGIFNR